MRDAAILVRAREEAARWLDDTSPDDPLLAGIRAGWGSRFGLVEVG